MSPNAPRSPYRVSLAEVLAQVRRFEPDPTPAARASRDATATLVASCPRPLDRTWFEPGHLTASAIVLAPGGDEVLLVHHRRLGRWLQPGGHVEPDDPSMEGAAAREAVEETGVSLAEGPGELVGIDVHAIPAARGEPEHLHHDLVFRFVAASGALVSTTENPASRWCRMDDLGPYDLDDAVRRSLARAVGARSGVRS